MLGRLPGFYGWYIIGCAVCASFARQGAAVATLSVFVAPMTSEFDWSRAEMSAAVSLGGILGALVSPWLGRFADRSGARLMLTAACILVGLCAFALAATTSLLWFTIAFSLARMAFASPFDIGISSAVANWFHHRRATAMAIVGVGSSVSLAIMPFAAQSAIDVDGWRFGWIVLAIAVIVIGAIPNGFMMIRRPEDLGLTPDGGPKPADPADSGRTSPVQSARPVPEVAFSLREAKRTPAFWLLMLFSFFVFPVQAGMSLHQAPHLVEQGIAPTLAASIVSVFSLSAAVSSIGFGLLGDRVPIRLPLALSAGLVGTSSVLMGEVTSAASGFVAAACFGAGIGGLMTLITVAWANYFGRKHFGAIRGATLPVQVIGQAAGPLIAGALYDWSGSYTLAFHVFTGCSAIAVVCALFAVAPKPSPE
jgi:MFS family permease